MKELSKFAATKWFTYICTESHQSHKIVFEMVFVDALLHPQLLAHGLCLKNIWVHLQPVQLTP
jgi:hypothetical protein